MFLNLIILILMLTSQAFASTTSSLSLYSDTSPTYISLDGFNGSGIDSNTVLMLHMDGTNGGTIFTDSSVNAIPVIPFGSAQTSTSSPKFGTASALFNGSTDYLTAGNTSTFDFMHQSTAKWTVDFWVKFNNFTNDASLVTNNQDGSNGTGINIGVNADRSINCYISYGSSGNFIVHLTTASSTYPNDTTNWHHIAVTYDYSLGSNNMNLYLDGTNIGSQTKTGNTPSSGDASTGMLIGSVNIAGHYFAGYMDEVRISNDVRWTTNFTPPSVPYSSAAVSQITLQNAGTQEAKLWMDGNDSNKFKIDDSTATRLTISGGNVGIGTTNPGFPLDVAGPVRIQTGLITNGTAPTVSTGAGDCGTSPSVTGNDISGTVTVGSGANGGQCTVTFSAAKSSTPNCICQNSTTANLTRAAGQSTTSFICTGTLTAGDKLVYWCPQ